MANKITYFGPPVIDGKYVQGSDIHKLPFYEFWRKSSIGSTYTSDPKTGEDLVYLDDWERFSRLFIETGRHRMMPPLILHNRSIRDVSLLWNFRLSRHISIPT